MSLRGYFSSLAKAAHPASLSTSNKTTRDPSASADPKQKEPPLSVKRSSNASEKGIGGNKATDGMADEKTPFLRGSQSQNRHLEKDATTKPAAGKRIVGAVVGTFRVVISAILAPGNYVIACFYDENGHFSALMPIYRIKHKFGRKNRSKTPQAVPSSSQTSKSDEKAKKSSNKTSKSRGAAQLNGSSTGRDEESYVDGDQSQDEKQSEKSSRHSRTSSSSSVGSTASEESDSQPRRLIRIQTSDEEELRQRRKRREQRKAASENQEPPLTLNTIKAPTRVPSSSRLKYPRVPAPPRPLIPKRAPSYSASAAGPPMFDPSRKTLVLDLDETLIHSMAKGGRMSTGHMVEVKLSTSVGAGGSVIGPQVPILYYVHKRPHCDEFLRKVKKKKILCLTIVRI